MHASRLSERGEEGTESGTGANILEKNRKHRNAECGGNCDGVACNVWTQPTEPL